MQIRAVKPHEIPLRLLEQKTCWNLNAFYELALCCDNLYGYVYGDTGEEWAALLFVDDQIYDSVVLDTLIVDRNARERTPHVIRSAVEGIGEALARQLHRRYVVTAFPNANRYIQMLKHPDEIQTLEMRYRKEVKPCL